MIRVRPFPRFLLPALVLAGSGLACQTTAPKFTALRDAVVTADVPGPVIDEGSVVEPATGPALPQSSDPRWAWDVTPFVWAADVAGEVSLGGQVIPVEEDFLDIVKKVDFSGSLAVVGRRPPWSVWLAGTYSKLASESPLPNGATADTETRQSILELLGARRILERGVGPEGSPSFALEVLAGARGWFQGATVDVVGGPTLVDQSQEWFDSVVGAAVFLVPSDRVTLTWRGDVGVLTQSESTWSLHGRADVEITRKFYVSGGLHVLDVDYDEGEGAERYVYKMNLRGPFVGAVFRF